MTQLNPEAQEVADRILAGGVAFCESAQTASTSGWHMRNLNDAVGLCIGQGGSSPSTPPDTTALCGDTVGWDLLVEIKNHIVDYHVCKSCAEVHRRMT